MVVSVVLKGSIAAHSYTIPSQALFEPSASLSCEPAAYYGIQHCGSSSDPANVLLVEPWDAHVHFQTVLPVNSQGQECNSVNHSGKNSTSNCNAPYPFERIGSMLLRYQSQGGAGIINTDYFGPDGDHGAQGLAVRNGDRLDGPEHGVTTSWAIRAPSLWISPNNEITISTPESQQYIKDHLADYLYNTVGGGPVIVQNGVPVERPCRGFIGRDTCSSASQSALGIAKDGRLVFITAAMNAEDLARYLVDNYSVSLAIKFDGGGSARLGWVDASGAIQTYGGKTENRPVAEGLVIFSQPVPPIEQPTPTATQAPPEPTASQPERSTTPTQQSAEQKDKSKKPGFWDDLAEWWQSLWQKSGIDGFGIGSNLHLNLGVKGNALSNALDEQKAMEAHWSREQIPWEEVEHTQDNFLWAYDFTADLGDTQVSVPRNYNILLKESQQRGIHVMALLAYGAFYLPKPAPEDELLERWRNYVQHVVDQYGDQIDYWEIGNEMNSREFWGKVLIPNGNKNLVTPDPALYGRMLKAAYEVIKMRDRKDVVILGGLVTMSGEGPDCENNPFAYLGQLKALGVWDSFDAIAIHPYWSTNPEAFIDRGMAHDPQTGTCLPDQRSDDNLLGEVRAYRDLAKNFGAKSIWITEIGWEQGDLERRAQERRATQPNSKTTGDQVEADYLVRAYVPLLSEPGIGKIFWFTQFQLDPRGDNHQLGQLGQRAFRNLSQLLTGSQPLGQYQGQNDHGGANDKDIYEYRFRKDDQEVIVLWKARGGDEHLEGVVVNDVPGSQIRLLAADAEDISVNAGKLLPVQKGQVTLALTERPIILIAEAPGSWENLSQQAQQAIEQWWQEQKDNLAKWWEQQQKNLEEKVQTWREEQQKHLEAWFEQQLQKLAKQWEQELMQCFGSAAIPVGLVVFAWNKQRRRRS